MDGRQVARVGVVPLRGYMQSVFGLHNGLLKDVIDIDRDLNDTLLITQSESALVMSGKFKRLHAEWKIGFAVGLPSETPPMEPNHIESIRFVLLKEGIGVFGSAAAVEEVIRQNTRPAPLSADLMRKLNDLNQRFDVWSSEASPEMKRERPRHIAELETNAPPREDRKNIRFSGGFKFGPTSRFEAELETGSSDTARVLQNSSRRKLKLIMMQFEGNPKVTKLLSLVEVTTARNVVTIWLALPAQDVGDLINSPIFSSILPTPPVGLAFSPMAGPGIPQ